MIFEKSDGKVLEAFFLQFGDMHTRTFACFGENIRPDRVYGYVGDQRLSAAYTD